MTHSNISTWLSLILATILLVLIVAAAGCLPWLTKTYLAFGDRYLEPAQSGLSDFQKILTLLYAILVPALVADVALLRLMQQVRREKVFEPQSIRCIRIISWCCIGETALFLLLGWYFPFSLVLAFMALFVGVCLRVVRHVLQTAARLKEENDLTV